jgi:hypothetical protein
MNRNPRRAYDEQGRELQPITVGWMRKQGMRSVAAYCEELPVPDISLKLRCSLCGSRSIHTRPDWTEMRAAGMGRDA